MAQTFVILHDGKEVPDHIVRDKGLMPDVLNPPMVHYNRLLVSVNSVPDITHQFCHQLYFVNTNENRDDYFHLPDGKVHPVSICGSMTGIEYKGRKLVIFSRHQAEERIDSLEDICIGFNVRGIDENGRLRRGICYVEADSYFLYNESEFDHLDIFICDFTKSLSRFIENNSVTILRQFFCISNKNIVSDSDDVGLCFIHGYPSQYSNCDGTYREDVNAWCNPLDEEISNPIGSCEIIGQSDFDPDGISGGPVFAFTRIPNRYIDHRLKFAGIIIKANCWKHNRKRVEYIKVDALRDIIEYSVEQPTSIKLREDIVRIDRTKPYGRGVLYGEDASLYGENRMPPKIC